MKKLSMAAMLTSMMLLAACSDDGDPTEVDTRPSVRFFNATTGLAGNGGFTANGQFAAGSALAPGQTTCSRVAEGTTSFAFGAANASGAGLSGSALATLDNQNIAAGGSYTVVATGPAASPTLLLFNNSFSGTLGSNQTAVRFANLAPPSGTTTYNYFAYSGAVGTTVLASNLAFGLASAYSTMTSGAHTFSVLQTPGHAEVVTETPFTLPGGSVNTMAIFRNASGGTQLVPLPRCS